MNATAPFFSESAAPASPEAEPRHPPQPAPDAPPPGPQLQDKRNDFNPDFPNKLHKLKLARYTEAE